MLNKKINVESNSIFFHSYMDRASGQLHDAILSKLSNSFSAGLSADNPLSTKSLVNASCGHDISREVDKRREYYRSYLFSTACINFCHSALREGLSAASTATLNINVHRSDIALPELPEISPAMFLSTFWGFSV